MQSLFVWLKIGFGCSSSSLLQVLVQPSAPTSPWWLLRSSRPGVAICMAVEETRSATGQGVNVRSSHLHSGILGLEKSSFHRPTCRYLQTDDVSSNHHQTIWSFAGDTTKNLAANNPDLLQRRLWNWLFFSFRVQTNANYKLHRVWINVTSPTTSLIGCE